MLSGVDDATRYVSEQEPLLDITGTAGYTWPTNQLSNSRFSMQRLKCLWASIALFTVVGSLSAQVPSHEEFFGWPPGADYEVADYEQLESYFHRLSETTERAHLIEIGRSAMGRPMLLLFISSEENLQQLERWRTTSERLARARINEDEARALAASGKAIVWLDGGMDDQEFAAAQMTPELAHRLVTSEAQEIRNIRENVIVLLMPILNPDAIANDVAWYREVRGTPFETTRPPRLGQPWAGTDNNRDWFMNNQPETRAASRILYKEWYPQIMYNQHQTGPSYTRIFIPPFADPVNPDIHPGVTTGVNLVGAAMAARFAQLGMPGYISRSVYSMWWNGGMRLTPYFHNQIGILTETSHRTPTPRTYDLADFPEVISVRRGLPARTDSTSISYPDPWFDTESHIRDAFDYMQEASIATLDLAARYRERFLYNMYRMGRDAIEAGEQGGPYAYVVPPDQWDASEAVNLVNVFLHSGVEVFRATRSFVADGIEYPASSHVLYAAQAFRPHLVNLMEPQRYPEREQYPGGPPETPYDLAGWTLPMQMGVRVDRIEGRFEARVEPVENLVAFEPGSVVGSGNHGYVLSPEANASFHVVNRLLAQGHSVAVTNDDIAVDDHPVPKGSFIVRNDGGNAEDFVESLATEFGVDFVGLDAAPEITAEELRLPRVGLYKPWHSRVDDQGWTLWLMEQYEFAVDTLHDADIRTGDLSTYDAILLPNHPGDQILLGNLPGTMPDEYVGGLGAEGAAALRRFVETGGSLIAFDASTDFPIDQFGLPVRNAVADLPPERFFIPGSLIRTDINVEHQLAHGMQSQVAASYSQSRAFEIVRLPRAGEGGREDIPEAAPPRVDVIASYAAEDLLMSGWAMGEERYLAGKAAMVSVGLGNGRVVLFGFRPQFRGQPRGTYKLVFNAINRATTLRNQPTSD